MNEYDYQIDDLKCCGNCANYWTEVRQCKINKNYPETYKVCNNWSWDNYVYKKRMR